MCIVSMVYDHYQPLIPQISPWQTDPWKPYTPPDPAATQRLIEEFRKALAAAATVDKLTGQPDCEDPEKVKLLDRIAELEKQLGIGKYVLKYTSNDGFTSYYDGQLFIFDKKLRFKFNSKAEAKARLDTHFNRMGKSPFGKYKIVKITPRRSIARHATNVPNP
jgi:hypothetical protein